MRRHLTPSFVISIMALFVALGGTGYAITRLPVNSVGSGQIKKNAITSAKIKKNAITSAKVKDRSLIAKDFKAGQLPAGQTGATGATGQTGATGATGAVGSALAYAYVEGFSPDPNVVAEKSKGIDSSMVSRPFAGIYCFQLETLWPVHVAAVTAESSFGNAADSDKYAMAQVLHDTDFGIGCPNTSDMVVITRDQSDAAAIDCSST